MIRLVARLAPVVLMAYPLWVYRGHMETLGRSRDWVSHTQTAKYLASRIAREAGCVPMPEKAGKTLEEFAVLTADNPTQVRLVAAMRGALARNEPQAVTALADEAEAEENRLLDLRRARFSAGLERTRSLADLVLACGVVIAVLLALIDFAVRRSHRRTLRPASEVEAERKAKDGALERERAANAELEQKATLLRNNLSDAELRLEIYEARYGRDRSYDEMRQTIDSLRDELKRPTPPREGPADVPH